MGIRKAWKKVYFVLAMMNGIFDTLICRFLFKFNGQDQEINLLGDGTEKAEFGEWSWMAPEQVIELVSIRDYEFMIAFLIPAQNQLRCGAVDNI